MLKIPTEAPQVRRNMRGDLCADTYIHLHGTRWVKVATYKGQRGILCVANGIERKGDGFETFCFGGPTGDWSKRLHENTERATAAAIERAHRAGLAALPAFEDAIMTRYPAPLELQAQTAADLKAKTEREAEALALEQRQREENEARAEADARLASFVLTGSNRPADVGAAAGQVDLFAGA